MSTAMTLPEASALMGACLEGENVHPDQLLDATALILGEMVKSEHLPHAYKLTLKDARKAITKVQTNP